MASVWFKLTLLVCLALVVSGSAPTGRDNAPGQDGHPGSPGHDGRPGTPGNDASRGSVPMGRDWAPGQSSDAGSPGTGPTPPIVGQLGDRCPFLPDENGQYPDYCEQYIGNDCECIYDDVHISQELCIANNRTEYEELVQHQMNLERKRDETRVKDGHPSMAAPYFHALDCLQMVPAIVKKQAKEVQALESEENAESAESDD